MHVLFLGHKLLLDGINFTNINLQKPVHWPNGLSLRQETGVQSQVESYQKLKKWYLIPQY